MSVHIGLAAALAVAPAAAKAPERCETQKCSERVARKQCARSRPVPCFRRAALLHDVPTRLLLAIGRCESHLQWWAHNPSGAAGPLQFLPGTWRSTPYRRHSPFSMKWAPIAGAWLIQHDGTHHWNPSRGCWGARA